MSGDSEAPAHAVQVSDTPCVAVRDRHRAAARMARQLCWVWIAPLGVVTLCLAYVSLIIVAFGAEAFETNLTVRAVVIPLVVPCGLFAAATGLGVVVASFAGRWLAVRMRRAASWAVGSIAALTGGTVGVGVFFLVLRSGA